MENDLTTRKYSLLHDNFLLYTFLCRSLLILEIKYLRFSPPVGQRAYLRASGEDYEEQGNCGVKAHCSVMLTDALMKMKNLGHASKG